MKPCFGAGSNRINVKRADQKNGQPSKIAVQKAKKKGFEIALKADFGRGDKIRTCGLYVPNVALYQTEPHLDGGFFNFSVSGQTCGQTTYIGNFIQLFTAELCSVFKGFVQCLQGLL